MLPYPFSHPRSWMPIFQHFRGAADPFRRYGHLREVSGRTVQNIRLDWYAYGAQAWWHGSVGSPLWSEHQTRGGMAQSVGRYCYHIVPPNRSHHFIVQIFAKLHSNPIWQKRQRFCFDIADKTPLRVCHRSALPHTDSQLCG